MNTVLNYTSPAQSWIEGLPLGNGSCAMMFFGNAKNEVFMLNHDRLWQNSHQKDFKTAQAIPTLKDCVKAKDGKAFHELFRSTVVGSDPACNAYQPLADLNFVLKSPCTVSSYRRSLDLSSGLLSVSYALEDNQIRYEAFSDFNCPVMRIKFSASRGIDLQLFYSREPDESCTQRVIFENGALIYDAALSNRVFFKAYTQIITNGIAVFDKDLTLQNVTELELRIVLATSLFCEDLEAFCRAALHNALPYGDALSRHRFGFSALFNRCSLELFANEQRSTEELYQNGQETGIPPLALYEQFADMARYVLICSSRENSLPCNLQGIWNHEIRPEWESGYTTDMNLQMYYWVANSTRLYECQEALFRWILDNREVMKRNAERIFGVTNAAYIPQYTDFRMEPTCWQNFGDFQVLWGGAAPWLSMQFLEYYRYTLDKDFLLEKAYPFMKDCAAFYSQLLSMGEDGKLHLYISASPENFVDDNTQIIDTATMDIALIRELFAALIQISDTYRIDTELCQTWSWVLENLVDYPIDESGTLLEWCDKRQPRDPGHRHLSHAYPLFPGKTCYKDDALKAAALKALERRLANNFGQSASWSYAWYACCFARIGNTEKEKECMQTLLIGSVISNLLSMYAEFKDPRDTSRQFATGRRIFQADAMLGYYAACIESVIQCYDTTVILLPALIDTWKKHGCLKGVAVYGGVIADVEWKSGHMSFLSLKAKQDCDILLQTRDTVKHANAPIQAEGNAYKVRLTANTIHEFYF